MTRCNRNKWIPYSRLSRRRRRDAFIRLRQKIRKDAPVYGGQFTSRHVFGEPDRPAVSKQWADFCFLGGDGLTIWDATIITASCAFMDVCEATARDRAWRMLTPEERSAETETKREPVRHKGGRAYRLTTEPQIVYERFDGLTYSDSLDRLTEEIIENEPPAIFESFSTDLSYRYGIGLHMVVNADEINRTTIEEAIRRFRETGERDWRSAEPVRRDELPRKLTLLKKI